MGKSILSRILPLSILFGAILALSCGKRANGGADAPGDASMITVRPEAIDDILDNPGRGFAEFHGWERGLDLHPAPTVSYYRWSWAKLEPAEGSYDFALVDACIARAKAKGLGFAFRIMPHWDDDGKGGSVPSWLRDKGVGFAVVSDGLFPDHNAPAFLQYHERLIKAFGERYNGSPDIDHVDIGSVGCWGEWNTACADGSCLDVCEGYYPTTENQKRIIDCYLAAFPDTPLVIPVGAVGGNETIRNYAIRKGIGWRGDSFGDGDDTFDLRQGEWNHTDYYDSLANAEDGPLKDVWKTAPVQFEVSGTMEGWKNKYGSHDDFNIGFVLEKGLEWHVSVLNAKSFPVPDAWRPKVDEFVKRMGYRIALDSLSHGASAKPGGTLQLRSAWKNVGVAPMYHRWPLAYRLRGADGSIAARWLSEADLRAWLPAEAHDAGAEEAPVHRVEETEPVPDTVAPGTYWLDIAILDEGGNEALVKIAIAGRRQDGWYAISSVRIAD